MLPAELVRVVVVLHLDGTARAAAKLQVAVMVPGLKFAHVVLLPRRL